MLFFAKIIIMENDVYAKAPKPNRQRTLCCKGMVVKAEVVAKKERTNASFIVIKF